MDNDFILVLDLGGPQAVEMARKLRNQCYYTEIMSRGADEALFRRKAPRGILVVGEDDCNEPFPGAALALDVPVLALGGAARRMIETFGAVSEGVLLKEQASQITFQGADLPQPCPLFDQLSESDRYFTRVDGFALPEGCVSIASTMEGYSPAFANFERRLYGLQFYAESNDPDGAVILSNFAEKICGCTPIWTAKDFLEEEVRYIRERVGEGSALMAVSGGVDSTTCALLMRRAIGERVTCVFIDTGLMRSGEAEQVRNTFEGELGLPLICVDAGERMLNRLRGVVDPVEKRQVIYEEYMKIFAEVGREHPEAEYFVEGTIYSALLARGSSDAVYARRFDPGKRLEPIRMLFKDEVRILSELLGMPRSLSARQPFPGPGLAVRCLGEVTESKLALLRRADAIFREQIQLAGQDKRLTRYFVLLDDARTLGRRLGVTTREYACVLRAVSEQGLASYTVGKLPYDLLERVAARIIREIPGINRVVYDISPCDNTFVEWQ